MAKKLLEIKNLNVVFHTRKGLVRAVRDLDLSINEGETLALVGESGCGKSVTAHSINGLIPSPPGEIKTGEVLFEGVNLVKLKPKEMEAYRGDRISMIFQEPMTSLNPVFKIGDQIKDVFMAHHKISSKEAKEKAIALLDLVKIPSPLERVDSYPHQLSGGMRQRVMIALALASPNPGLLIADEPTTALDVTIQAQILSLLGDLKEKINMSLLLITHDMGVVAETADRVAVMYAGRKVEEGNLLSVFENPGHPYTRGLLNSRPHGDTKAARLKTIGGKVPDLLTIKEECPFLNRCDRAINECTKSFPTPRGDETHKVWCHNPAK